MRKIFGIIVGGIQQKIFNLVLIAMIIITGILAETSEKQLESIDKISSAAMEAVVRDTLQTTARLESEIADGVFSNYKGTKEFDKGTYTK